MRHGFRVRLTYSNVVSTICLFIVLGGAAYAANALPKNSVGAKQLKKGAVVAAKVKNGAITSAKLGAGAVSSEKLANGAVLASKLGEGSVTAGKLGEGAVGTGKLGNGAVTTGKLGDAAVTTGKLGEGAVTTGKLANDAATGQKVNESTLHFTCNFPVGKGAFQLPGGGLCAFTSGGANTWEGSVNVCRGAATGGTMPTGAEFAAIADVTGSPFRGIAAWTSEVAGGATPKGNIVTTGGGGEITSISQTDLTLSPTTTTACVYDPALAPAP